MLKNKKIRPVEKTAASAEVSHGIRRFLLSSMVIAVLLMNPFYVYAGQIIIDKVAASIQGVGVITSLQLMRYAAVNAVSEDGPSKGIQDMKDDEYIRSSLNQLIDKMLMLKDAKLLSIKTPDQKEVNILIEQFKAKFSSNINYDAFIRQYAINEDYLNKYMSDELIIKQYIYDEIRILVKISEKNIKAYYQNNKEAFKGLETADIDQQIKKILEQKEYDRQLKSWIKTLSLHREIIILY